MPVQKFRSVEEMDAAPASDTRLSDFERFLRHSARYRAIAQKTYPRGVFKFRTLEDAQRARADVDLGSAPPATAIPNAKGRT